MKKILSLSLAMFVTTPPALAETLTFRTEHSGGSLDWALLIDGETFASVPLDGREPVIANAQFVENRDVYGGPLNAAEDFLVAYWDHDRIIQPGYEGQNGPDKYVLAGFSVTVEETEETKAIAGADARKLVLRVEASGEQEDWFDGGFVPLEMRAETTLWVADDLPFTWIPALTYSGPFQYLGPDFDGAVLRKLEAALGSQGMIVEAETTIEQRLGDEDWFEAVEPTRIELIRIDDVDHGGEIARDVLGREAVSQDAYRAYLRDIVENEN